MNNISVLNLSIRSHNALLRAGVTTVEHLEVMDANKLKKIRNLSQKSVEEVMNKLKKWKEEI